MVGQAPHGLSAPLHGRQDDSADGSSLGCLPQGTASLSRHGLAGKEQPLGPEGVSSLKFMYPGKFGRL